MAEDGGRDLAERAAAESSDLGTTAGSRDGGEPSKGPPAPGWWLASDGNWYPPETPPAEPMGADAATKGPVAQSMPEFEITEATDKPSQDEVDWFAEQFGHLVDNIEQAIHGKREVVELALISMLSEGHLLLEDVPGVGKTSLARAIAASIGLDWHRIQFTPDLLPSDVIGISIFNQATQDFEFRPGPVFSNLVLGDEINRASPKTQSALLEVMEERHVTVDGVAYPAPRPFMVIATQNPIEMEGTYALPESQIDRFFIRTEVGYPGPDAEASVLRGQRRGSATDLLEPVVSPEDIECMIDISSRVRITESLESYVVDIVRTATRVLPELRLGASPRGSLGLSRAARTRAVSHGRAFVTPEDIKELAVPVLAHRLILTAKAELEANTPGELLERILESATGAPGRRAPLNGADPLRLASARQQRTSRHCWGVARLHTARDARCGRGPGGCSRLCLAAEVAKDRSRASDPPRPGHSGRTGCRPRSGEESSSANGPPAPGLGPTRREPGGGGDRTVASGS